MWRGFGKFRQHKPELLVSHAYTRYMGDLSGGQILQKIAKQAMGLHDSDGTAFYEFEAIANHGQFKKDYRHALDTLDVSPEMKSNIVDEANHAFHLEYGNVPGTQGQLVADAV
jgi:heme oxygenase